MEFVPFLDLDNLDYYGDIPEIPKNRDGRVEVFPLNNQWEDADLFLDDLDEIDRRCDALLGYGDVDFFNSEKCVKLKAWIDERLQKPIIERYRELLEVLRSFCERAIVLQTGVVIDL